MMPDKSNLRGEPNSSWPISELPTEYLEGWLDDIVDNEMLTRSIQAELEGRAL